MCTQVWWHQLQLQQVVAPRQECGLYPHPIRLNSVKKDFEYRPCASARFVSRTLMHAITVVYKCTNTRKNRYTHLQNNAFT